MQVRGKWRSYLSLPNVNVSLSFLQPTWLIIEFSLSFLHRFLFIFNHTSSLSISILRIHDAIVGEESSPRTLCSSISTWSNLIHIFQTDKKSPSAHARNERPSSTWNRQEMFSLGSWWDTSTQLFPSTFDPISKRMYCCISIIMRLEFITPLHSLADNLFKL